MYMIVLVAVILCVVFKILNVNNSPHQSLFYCANAKFLDQMLKSAPKLAEPYSPTKLWGYSGHVQTIFQGVVSRLSCPLVDGRRHFIRSSDGATVTYDTYHAIDRHPSNEDITVAVAPGICNSSESIYVRRVVYHAQFQGYRVAVLNHIGTLGCVPVTSPRIFSFGSTEEYDLMIQDLVKKNPNTKIICVGFSMGGNIVTKYLGHRAHPRQVIAGISACQGYDAQMASTLLLQWEGFRRLYFFVMTENMRAIIRRWQAVLLPDSVKRSFGINERAVWAAATMVELDEEYTRKIHGFKNVQDMYAEWSCINHWDNIEVPMVFINAEDDPLVPPVMLSSVRQMAEKKRNFLYIEQKYGGHLGFFEGGFINPNALTWLDRVVVELSHGLTAYTSEKACTDDEFFSEEDTPRLSEASSDEMGSQESLPDLLEAVVKASNCHQKLARF